MLREMAVEYLKPAPIRYYVSDSHWLALEVLPSKAMAWRYLDKEVFPAPGNKALGEIAAADVPAIVFRIEPPQYIWTFRGGSVLASPIATAKYFQLKV